MFRILSTALAIALIVGVGLTPVAAAASATAAGSENAAGSGSTHGTGALHDPRLRIAPHRVAGLSTVALPSAVDLSAWTVPVGDQGDTGSCVAWAISYAMNGWYSRYQGTSTKGIQFAPMYSYSQIHATNDPDGGGTWPYAAYGIGTSQGIDTQADYWQGNYDFTDLPTASQKANASRFKAGTFSYLYSSTPGVAAVDAIESAVAAHHPVAITLPVYSAFDNLDSTNFHLDARQVDVTTYRGSHEVLIVGYDGTGVKIQNSWGTWWGLNGFAYLNWNFVESYTDDATMIPGLVPTLSAPLAPTTLQARVSGSTAAVSWAPPTSDGGSPITGYRVTRDGTNSRGAAAWSTNLPATARSQLFRYLGPGTTYHLSVQAVNTVGAGPIATATVTMAKTAPTAPISVTATTNDPAKTATLSWAPPTSDGGSPITAYRVTRDGTNSRGAAAWSTNLAATARSQKFQYLGPGATYHLSVQAINAVGAGPIAIATAAVTAG